MKPSLACKYWCHKESKPFIIKFAGCSFDWTYYLIRSYFLDEILRLDSMVTYAFDVTQYTFHRDMGVFLEDLHQPPLPLTWHVWLSPLLLVDILELLSMQLPLTLPSTLCHPHMHWCLALLLFLWHVYISLQLMQLQELMAVLLLGLLLLLCLLHFLQLSHQYFLLHQPSLHDIEHWAWQHLLVLVLILALALALSQLYCMLVWLALPLEQYGWLINSIVQGM